MERFNSIILSENVKARLDADVKNSCDEWEDMVDEFMQSNGHTKNADGLYEFVNRDDFVNMQDYLILAADLENMERKILPTFNNQEEEEYRDFKDIQDDDERGLQQCIDYLNDSFNDILFFYEKQDGTWGDTVDTYYYYHNYDQDKEHSVVLEKNRFIDYCMTKWQQLEEYSQTHFVKAVVAITRRHYIYNDFEDSRVGRWSDTPEKKENENDFEFWSESGYVKIDKLTVGDFTAVLEKVNKSLPDITAKGMRYIENELRYYYDNWKLCH